MGLWCFVSNYNNKCLYVDMQLKLFCLNGVLGHYSALIRLYWAGITWANEINFVMKHAPAAGLIAGPVD